MPLKGSEAPPAVGLPQTQRPVLTPREGKAAVGTQRYPRHSARVSLEGAEPPPAADLPQPQRVVLTPRKGEPAVGTPPRGSRSWAESRERAGAGQGVGSGCGGGTLGPPRCFGRGVSLWLLRPGRPLCIRTSRS